ncbi:MAG: exo-alpha-sialidase [Planctomycetes bacterium]|nr:exo-alpha-sialidase [Planctomycetota bacterium]
MRMIVPSALLLVGLAGAHGEGAASTQPARQLDQSTLGLMALDKDSESDTAAEAYLGDGPGDLVRVKTTAFAGFPLALADGTVMMWSTAKRGDKQVARAVFSRNNGLAWSDAVDWFEFPNREKAQWTGGASLVDNKGYIHLFGLEYYQFDFKDRSKAKSPLWHARSRDGGKTWDPVHDVPFGFGYTGSSNNAFQSRTGRIFAPLSALSNRRTGVWVSLCPYSDDNGATWKMPSGEVAINTGAADWYESGAAEPVGIQLTDGRIWLLPRSQDGFQWESFSSDDGMTWTPARHSRFVSNQSAMAVLRLKDGRLLLLWNNCGAEGLPPIHWGNAERAVLAAAISDDEGKTWRGYREVARVTTNAQVSYPYVTQMPNGRLIVNAAGVIATFHPELLSRTEFSETFDRGSRRWSTLASEGVSAVGDPDGGAGKVLKMVKPKADVTSAACLNFPFGRSGTITIALRNEHGFQGAHLTLSDHYDLPGLSRDACFPIQINPKGRIFLNGSGGSWLATPGDLTPAKWHELKLTWDCPNHEALLELDGVEIGRLHQYVCTDGICYLRIRSTAATIDKAGMYVKSVKVTVSP